MTRDEILETMARAIAASQGHYPDEMAPAAVICGKQNQLLPWWRAFEEEAAAALTALEAKGVAVVPVEPAQQMLDAAEPQYSDDWRDRHQAIKDIWSAMITAASHAGTGGCGSEQRERVANPNPPPQGPVDD